MLVDPVNAFTSPVSGMRVVLMVRAPNTYRELQKLVGNELEIGSNGNLQSQIM